MKPKLELVKEELELNSNPPGSLPIGRLFPNIVTLCSMCAGLSAIRYSMDEKWEIAAILILVAGFLDGMDGRLARMLKATSNFGAYLDSLADFLNFGIAPSITLYLWSLHNIQFKGLGWAIVLFYSICCAIRLARFNSDLDKEDGPEWSARFFVGMPSTAGAFVVLAPFMLSFYDPDLKLHPLLLALYMSVIAILMTSHLPTFSLKKVVIKRNLASVILALFGIFIITIVIEPWLSLPIIGILYLCTIPFSYMSFRKFELAESKIR